MSDSPAISISYTLQPPSSISTTSSSTPTHLKQSVPLTLPTSSPDTDVDTKTYYTALSASVLETQATLNQHLTSWKDAIGDGEKAKEDLGKVGFGKGKAARMVMADKAAEAGGGGDAGEDDDGDEDEDEE